MSYEQIIYMKDDGVAIITLNRPQVLNAFTPIMIDEWVRAIEAAKLDPEVRAVIVTGAGRGFCSGADVRSFREREHTDGNPVVDGRYWLQHSVHRVPLALRTLDKPYIAAVNGPAAGAGMDMASMADLRIASDTARFTMSYVNSLFFLFFSFLFFVSCLLSPFLLLSCLSLSVAWFLWLLSFLFLCLPVSYLYVLPLRPWISCLIAQVERPSCLSWY